jgi:hypothetical protein
MGLLFKQVEGYVTCDRDDTGNKTVSFNPLLTQIKQNFIFFKMLFVS